MDFETFAIFGFIGVVLGIVAYEAMKAAIVVYLFFKLLRCL